MPTIIAPLPFTLTDGEVADATEVMANLNRIRNDVNNNVPASNAIVLNDDPDTFYNGQGEFTSPTVYRGAVVGMSGDYVLADNTNVKLAFDAESIDTDAIHSNSVNNTRLTVPAGVTRVRLIARAYTDGQGGTNQWQNAIEKNGGGIFSANGFMSTALTSSGTSVIVMTPTLVVTAGDYFELNVIQNTGGPINIYAAATYFEMQVLG